MDVRLLAPCPIPRASLVLAALLFVPAARAAEPKPAPREVRAGSLVIVGGGKMPEAIRARFVELAGGKEARIVIIPTANLKADLGTMLETYQLLKAFNPKSLDVIHTLDRKVADTAEFIKPLTEATGVWIMGGDQSRLSLAYHGTAVEKELFKVVARGGVVGGTSAGAAVMSALMIVGGTTEARVGDGFGLLTGVVVDQHFQNRRRLERLMGVLEKHPQLPGVGIDEETALEVHGQTAVVLGNGNVVACLCARGTVPASVTILKAGEKVDLAELIRTALARDKTLAESKAATPNDRATPTPKR